MLRIIHILGAILLVGCQSSPTRVIEKDVDLFTRSIMVQKKLGHKLRLTPTTVILDTRPAFSYEMSHLPGAVWIDANSFLLNKIHESKREDKYNDWARSLALIGIDPQTHVIVIGSGGKGAGDEGLVAWSLLYLGVSQVQMATMSQVRLKPTHKPTELVENVAIWVPLMNKKLFSIKFGASIDNIKVEKKKKYKTMLKLRKGIN